MIEHSELLEIAALPILIYDYAKRFTLNKDETVEEFLNSESEEIEALSETRKEVLENMKTYAPYGQVVQFFEDEHTDLQAGITISHTKERICVVFRGSESLTDWYYDLMINKKRLHDNVYVHKGFYNHIIGQYDSIKARVHDLLEMYPNYKLCITGHSLGAASCLIVGYMLSKSFTCQVIVITFASPRVGNSNFKKAVDNQVNLQHYRVTNDRDIITAAPMYNYKHCGINIHLTENDIKIHENYNYNTWFQFSLFNCWRVSDHNMELYYKRLKKNSWKK
jgi:predicted lipase